MGICEKTYEILEHSNILGTNKKVSGTLNELVSYYKDVLELGLSIWQNIKSGRLKINTKPSSIQSLITNLNKALANLASVKDIKTPTAKTYSIAN